MREIKFRAWLTEEKKMVDVYRLDFTDKNGDPTFVMWYWVQKGTQAGLSKGFELMQYTGLKDKNDKEIYEGDIVANSYGCLAVIKWLNSTASFRGIPIQAWVKVNERDTIDTSDLEVVGNIYENPELLEQQKGGGNNE